MDLALALVEDDLGRDVALEVARQLVLFLQRPGGQAQFSAGLAAQPAGATAAPRAAGLAAPTTSPTTSRVAALAERAAHERAHRSRAPSARRPA